MIIKAISRLLFLIAIAISMLNYAWAENSSTQELREQQKKLEELLDRIGKAQDQRSQQRATLRKLEKQMTCNWALIQDYDDCEKKYSNNLEAHVKCKHRAREKAAECLSSSPE